MERCFISVKGIVQGVGFRPYVYNHATRLSLKGWVNNTSEGVFIDIEGDSASIKEIINLLRTSPPPLSKIHSIDSKNLPKVYYEKFEIRNSLHTSKKNTMISPDMCTCEDCFKDISDPHNHRYKYPFTNCTNCGPRFTIIKDVPYDRDKTTMDSFPMCSDCSEEYTNPSNRRFHAQPNACPDCGPKIWVEDCMGNPISLSAPLAFIQDKLLSGNIVGIKGLGGFHICCDAFNEDAIDTLRKRKNRPYKSLAVMIDDPEILKPHYRISTKEEKLLKSKERPIVILDRKSEGFFPESLAPNINTCGVMLPYTPLHKLLFSEKIKALVMTSGNISSLPMEYTNSGARENLSPVVDFFLFHNRDIHIPIDDSIVRVMNGEPHILRRSRGYVPLSFKHETSRNILALGPNMKNTFAISKDDNIIMSQYTGDLFIFENSKLYKRNISHFLKLYDVKPEHCVCDLHPGYFSSSFGKTLGLHMTSVQHHHAHLVSCMAENNLLNSKVIGVVLDGTGLGDDGNIWGGEFFHSTVEDSFRVTHLDYLKIFGGNSAIKNPWKISLSYLIQLKNSEECSLSQDELEDIMRNLLKGAQKPLESIDIFEKALDKNINTFVTSSMGRLFDCISALIDVCSISTYEGQASIELENTALKQKSDPSYYEDILRLNSRTRINTLALLNKICIDIVNKIPGEKIALRFHNTVAEIIVSLSEHLRHKTSTNIVCLTGGVFQNKLLLEKTWSKLREKDFLVYTQKSYPCNDGGISLGQAIYGDAIFKNSN